MKKDSKGGSRTTGGYATGVARPDLKNAKRDGQKFRDLLFGTSASRSKETKSLVDFASMGGLGPVGMGLGMAGAVLKGGGLVAKAAAKTAAKKAAPAAKKAAKKAAPAARVTSPTAKAAKTTSAELRGRRTSTRSRYFDNVSKGTYNNNVKQVVKQEMRSGGTDALIAKRGVKGVRPFSKTWKGTRTPVPTKPSKTGPQTRKLVAKKGK